MSRGRLLLIWASFGCLLSVSWHWLSIGQLPLWLLGIFLFCYTCLLILGAMAPQLEMYGDVICDVPEAGPYLALTFDDGPDPGTTPRVLDLLKASSTRATFFVIGEKAQRFPDLIRRMADEGHSIGVHSWSHDRLFAFRSAQTVAADSLRCVALVEALTGQRPLWVRPPVGQASPSTFRGFEKAGLSFVAWSARGRDGLRGTSVESWLDRIERGLQPGAILLLHDAWERGGGGAPAGVLGLSELLRSIAELGLTPVTVDELLRRGLAPPPAK